MTEAALRHRYTEMADIYIRILGRRTCRSWRPRISRAQSRRLRGHGPRWRPPVALAACAK